MPPIPNGYLKMARILKDSAVFNNEKWLKVWIWCLIKANHQPTNVPVQTGRGTTVVKLQRGQFIFGRKKAAKDLNMKPSTVRNILEKLKNLRNLDTQPDTHFTIITICNYDFYQDDDNYKGQAEGQPKDRQRTGKGQPKDTDNNEKNVNNEKKRESPLIDFDSFLKNTPEYITNRWNREQIRNTSESLLDYCRSKGRSYKDYYSALRNFLKKDYPPNASPPALKIFGAL